MRWGWKNVWGKGEPPPPATKKGLPEPCTAMAKKSGQNQAYKKIFIMQTIEKSA